MGKMKISDSVDLLTFSISVFFARKEGVILRTRWMILMEIALPYSKYVKTLLQRFHAPMSTNIKF